MKLLVLSLPGVDDKIFWRHNGQVNGDELSAKILGHLGDYYAP